jgi:hypothetical protein
VRSVAKTIRPFSILVALLAVGMFAVVGFRVGRSQRASAPEAANTWDSAAAANFSHARAASYRVAWQDGYQHGWAAGVRAANLAGIRAGRATGRAEAAVRAVAARAVASVLASTPRNLSRAAATARCVPVGGGLCEVLGPRVTGQRCPPASVPYPEGGAVCVPRVLLLAAQLTGTPTVIAQTP